MYRRVQYAFCGRKIYGLIAPGVKCHIEPFKEHVNHGDVVHPCVRYIPEGYEGHCWWLVYTPYYGADPGMENPILCYAESNEPIPPTEWKVYCEVKGKPDKGYNSDPALLYAEEKLYVFWREYQTPSILAAGHQVGTFGAVINNGGIIDEFGPVVWSDDSEIDLEVSPTFIYKGGVYNCLSMHLRFHSKVVKRIKNPFRNVINILTTITDLIGCYSQQRHYGIAIWETDNVDEPYRYRETVKFRNCNRLYRPWHMDFFEYKGKWYAIVQTNQCNADICLAWSNDGRTFTFFDSPLITNASIKKLGIYKPCAGVTPDGVFFLYYTAQETNDRAFNKLYLTKMKINDLFNKLQRLT